MPSQSRSQRRRQQQRTQRPPVSPRPTPATPVAPEIDETPIADDVAVLEEAVAVAPEELPEAPSRIQRKQRRVVRPAPEPVDYTFDYQSARHDLRRIAILSILLLVAMVALRFSGIV